MVPSLDDPADRARRPRPAPTRAASTAERDLDVAENRAFLADLAVRVGIRVAVLLPADGRRVRVVWAAGPEDPHEVARLSGVGRAWLADPERHDATDRDGRSRRSGPDAATVVIPLRHRRGPDAVTGVMVVAKGPDGSWSAAELALVRLVAGFLSDEVDDWLRRPAPTTTAHLPAVIGAGMFAGRSDLEAGMRAAPGRGELFVLFQPEVDLTTSAVVALEALVRWRHPERGEVGPDSFIAEAERSDLITVVGEWVLGEALDHARRWQEELPDLDVVVRVNVSPVQLLDPDFAATVAHAVARRSMAPDRLCIEITENTRIVDVPSLRHAVDQLHAAGVATAMDDFASGFSSLGRLRVLDVDAVKLDRSVISGVDDDSRAQAIVRASAALAADLGIDLVAEGVERPEEAATVAGLGVRRAQGHLFGRPMSPAAAGRLLADRGRRRPASGDGAHHADAPG